MDHECEQCCRCSLTEDELRNEEACDELERIEAECEAYHAECETHVDMEIAWLKGCGR